MRLEGKYKKSVLGFFVLFLVILILNSCNFSNHQKSKKDTDSAVQNDLERILSTGVLRAVVDYNSTNYFVYRGKPMGFEYELLQALSNDMGVGLQIVVSNNLSETFDGLVNNRYDLIAKNLTVTLDRGETVDFIEPLEQTSQVLVQRVGDTESDASTYISSTLDLAGKRIYVQDNTSYYTRLVNLSEEIGSEIDIVEDTIYGVEELVKRVAEGDIDYTICDENIAKLNQTYYPNLDVSLKVSFPQNIAWAVRKGSDAWKKYLDDWIINFKSTTQYRQLYHRYFESPRISQRMDSDFHSITGGKISEYDETVKNIAGQYGLDWRLISSVIYEESRFNPEAESWAGAYGLMQIMPSTASSLGIEDYKNPLQNIEAGVELLDWLNNQFIESVPDSANRTKFVLAAYNVGLGHIKDAQRLADKYGKDSSIWDDNVDFFLKSKSSERYFKDSVVRWGYCRGEETYAYVSKVINNYHHYQNLIPL